MANKKILPPKSSAKNTKSKKKTSLKANNIWQRKVIIETKRHWIGLVYSYGLIGFGIILIFIFFILFTNILSSITITLIVIGINLIIFHLFYKIYFSNKLTISNIDIRQNLRNSLFNTKFSSLNLIDIEDITYVKNNILGHIFDYGTLSIETAGEQTNFSFAYCPNPDKVRQAIYEARISYIKSRASIVDD